MKTMNISLPDAHADERVNQGGYGTSSELMRKKLDCLRLRDLLLAGEASAPAAVADPAYFEGLRDRLRKQITAKRAADDRQLL